MVTRRKLLGGGLFAGIVGALTARVGTHAEGIPQRDDREGAELVAKALEAIRSELRSQRDACTTGACPELELIRQQQRLFLRSSRKYPDFIEVGLDVWERLYDWHVRNRQPIGIAQTPDGRLGLRFMLTTLVLVPEAQATFVSTGYDAR